MIIPFILIVGIVHEMKVVKGCYLFVWNEKSITHPLQRSLTERDLLENYKNMPNIIFLNMIFVQR